MHKNTGAHLYNNYITHNYIGLKTTSLRTSRFYIPRRPVISSVNYNTSMFFKVCRLSSSANSSTNTIDNSYLVSLDVNSLCTSIPNSEEEQ